MPSWTYSISIVNNTDRTLELVSSNIPWGKKTQDFPQKIESKKTGEFSVYSPAANPTGIEFYFSLRDIVTNNDDTPYGLINFSLDMPYWKHGNSSALKCTGAFKQEGFEEIPDGAHDFATSATIFSTAQVSSGSTNEPQYHGIYEWESVKKLAIIDPANTNIENLIPDSNILFDRRTEIRTNTFDISKEMWNQINDKKFSDNFAKEKYVRNYFAVSAYEIRKNNSFTVLAGQDYSESVEIKRCSAVKKEVSSDFQIENTLNLNIDAGKIALSDVLKQSFGIKDIKTYSTESTETVKQALSFEAADYNRDVVLWDVVKVVAIYRETSGNKIDLIGVGDYHVATVPKVYGGKS